MPIIMEFVSVGMHCVCACEMMMYCIRFIFKKRKHFSCEGGDVILKICFIIIIIMLRDCINTVYEHIGP